MMFAYLLLTCSAFDSRQKICSNRISLSENVIAYLKCF